MLEYMGQMIESVDIAGLGVYIPILSLSIGLSVIVSTLRNKDDLSTMLITMVAIHSILTFGVFVFTQEMVYLLLTLIFIVIAIFVPKGESK